MLCQYDVTADCGRHLARASYDFSWPVLRPPGRPLFPRPRATTKIDAGNAAIHAPSLAPPPSVHACSFRCTAMAFRL